MLQLAALKGVFTHVVDEQVTFVNAPALAAERGVDVELTAVPESANYRSVVTLRAAHAGRRGGHGLRHPDRPGPGGEARRDQRLRLRPARRGRGHAFFRYADRPGVMGRVGSLLGEAAVNIEAAQVSQTTDGTDAIMLLRVDRPVDPGVLEPIGASIGARTTRLDLVRLTGSK